MQFICNKAKYLSLTALKLPNLGDPCDDSGVVEHGIPCFLNSSSEEASMELCVEHLGFDFFTV